DLAPRSNLSTALSPPRPTPPPRPFLRRCSLEPRPREAPRPGAALRSILPSRPLKPALRRQGPDDRGAAGSSSWGGLFPWAVSGRIGGCVFGGRALGGRALGEQGGGGEAGHPADLAGQVRLVGVAGDEGQVGQRAVGAGVGGAQEPLQPGDALQGAGPQAGVVEQEPAQLSLGQPGGAGGADRGGAG